MQEKYETKQLKQTAAKYKVKSKPNHSQKCTTNQRTS